MIALHSHGGSTLDTKSFLNIVEEYSRLACISAPGEASPQIFRNAYRPPLRNDVPA